MIPGAEFIVPAAYFAAAVMFIYGLKGMSSPVTARQGMIWAGIAMLLAVVVTFMLMCMSLLWSKWFRLGPAEWLLRKITYSGTARKV